MIHKELDYNISDLYSKYKENYSPIISEFTKKYSYTVDNENAGFIIFDIIYDRCEIIDVYTVEKFRNMGIATKLINEIINDYEINNITLEVSVDNCVAIKLYEKLGFKSVTLRKEYYDGTDAFLMLKEVR